MAANDFSAETPANAEEKTICCFVVDVSGSMSGNPISSLNKGLQDFHAAIGNDSMLANCLEVAIVEFGSTAETVLSPALVDDFSMPTLTTKGTTALVDGVRDAMTLVEDRKNWYKSTGQTYKRPWVILITDGEPDRNQDIGALEKEIETVTKNRGLMFLSLGVVGANMNILSKIAGYTEDANKNWKKMPPMKLQGLKFADFFEWVSASMSVVASSTDGAQASLPDPSSWMEGFTV